jgi:hypothetical protein
VVHAYNPSTQEADVGGYYRVQGQPELSSRTLYQTKKMPIFIANYVPLDKNLTSIRLCFLICKMEDKSLFKINCPEAQMRGM